jgi:hypothetical protein
MDTDERLVLYQMALQDIRDLKANQWRFSHYGLLIQAALVAANTMLVVPWMLCGLSAVACLGIGFLIHEAQGQIAQLRPATDSLGDRRDDTMADWSDEFGPKRLNLTELASRAPEFWKRDRPFAFLFASVQIVATFVAIWVMWLE